MLKGFQKFGTGLKILITIFIAIAVFEYQTGIHFPLFRVMVEEDSNGTIPLENSFFNLWTDRNYFNRCFSMVGNG